MHAESTCNVRSSWNKISVWLLLGSSGGSHLVAVSTALHLARPSIAMAIIGSSSDVCFYFGPFKFKFF
jgi:hypothetical protein